MKAPCLVTASAAGFFLLSACALRGAGSLPPAVIYETPHEFFGTGDFDGDGRMDLVIVDKETGKYRLGYQLQPGTLTWVDCRPSGLKSVTGFSIGKVISTNVDGFAFASPTGEFLSLADASDPNGSKNPVMIQFTEALGPSFIAAVRTDSQKPLADLYVGSTLNSPDPNLGTLLRNGGTQFPKIAEEVLPGAPSRFNPIKLKVYDTLTFCCLLSGEKANELRVQNVIGGKPGVVASVGGLPAGFDYAFDPQRIIGTTDFFFYKPGTATLDYRQLTEPAPDKFQFGASQTFDLGQPIRRLMTLNMGSGKSFIIFGEGEKGGIFKFGGSKAPELVQDFYATNSLFTCAAALANGVIVFAQPTGGKFSTKYQVYTESGGKYIAGAFGTLPTLADNDNVTIPDIYARSVAAAKAIQNEKEMKAYTNTIPGTQVTYSLVPIPSGEFVMGSPKNETGRKDDEGPQHKVKISPFWMGQFEVTWNEYELFMFPDEERRTRLTMVSDAAGDKLADAVTHPSRPYVEMSFGMGKDGFPAISMTQHGANKYCQWLSAKTGHFYRLPTEAEWEYAARAGTTTTYFFGDDKKQLGEYAWYEDNSDFKYQKVGKKKPNPWGLYDIYGNVVEWVLDQYDPNFYKDCASKPVIEDPWRKATKPYPHSVRGGSWDDPADACRSAARRGSEKAWKATDPQLPKSIWYLTDAQWVGLRIVRPLKVPPPEEMQKYWNSGVEKE